MGYIIKDLTEVNEQKWIENDQILLEYQGKQQAILKYHNHRLVLKFKASNSVIIFFQVREVDDNYDFSNNEELKNYVVKLNTDLIETFFSEIKFLAFKNKQYEETIKKQQKLLRKSRNHRG